MKVNLNTKYLSVLLLVLFSFLNAKAETKDQQVKITLRAIGNDFLLQMKDSTSRVLPIEIEEGRYVVKFERTFSFEPGLLSYSVFKTFENFDINDSYIVEVEECESKELIHSFKVDLKENEDEIACRGRVLPEGCYQFYFTLIAKTKKENIEISTTKSSSGTWYVVLALLVGLFLFLYFKNRKNKNKKGSDVFKVGKYFFDKKEMTLTLNKQFIELSSMEANLLFLLYSNENKTLKRELILQEIWGDEGNYVGRTLDVFISKLRKKLEADSKIKIVNVRGVGYKMVIS